MTNLDPTVMVILLYQEVSMYILDSYLHGIGHAAVATVVPWTGVQSGRARARTVPEPWWPRKVQYMH